MKNFLLLLLGLSLLTGCATSPTGRSQLMLMSPESAIASSKQAYTQTLQPLRKEGKVDSDPVVTNRVRVITGRIIAQTIQLYPKTRNWEWSVKVIDEPDTVNAWCMAGGKMAVYTGIINKLKITDDELAQVMGHEISHAVANHTAEKMSMAMASSVGLIGLGIATKDVDNNGAILAGGALAASVAVALPNSRTAEKEADFMGIKLAALAGYNPNAAVTLWRKMEKVGGNKVPEFLSTHPSPQNRQATLAALAGDMMPYYQAQRDRPVYPLN